jgi:hypothetical protein
VIAAAVGICDESQQGSTTAHRLLGKERTLGVQQRDGSVLMIVRKEGGKEGRRIISKSDVGRLILH